MKKYNKVLLILFFVMICSMVACSPKKVAQEESQQEVVNKSENVQVSKKVKTHGMLSRNNLSNEEFNEIMNGEYSSENGSNYYDNLMALILSLRRGEIDKIIDLPESTVDYIVSRNEDLNKLYSNRKEIRDLKMRYSMALKKTDRELYVKINNAIRDMRDDGTLDNLRNQYIDVYKNTENEPPVVEVPKIEGADTIKFAITGDLPPMDFVSADGTPAGYNIAILSEISKRLNMNIEVIQVDTASRAIALQSGRVDVIFWILQLEGDLNGHRRILEGDIPDGVVLTESYFSDNSAQITLANQMMKVFDKVRSFLKK